MLSEHFMILLSDVMVNRDQFQARFEKVIRLASACLVSCLVKNVASVMKKLGLCLWTQCDHNLNEFSNCI